MNANSTNLRDANSIADVRQIAQNQIQQRIWELQERIKDLEYLKVEAGKVIDWKTHNDLQIENEEDLEAITALRELAEYHQTMVAGNYF